jgi:hypothetical protein
VHHLDRRSEGGTHDPKRLIPLCSAHHAAEHDGRLIIEGDAVSGFRFYHGDRTAYGAVTAPESTMAWADAFSTLKNLGFKEGAVRNALEAVRPELDRAADTQSIVRAGLRRLHRDRHEGSRPRPAPPAPTPPKAPTEIEASSERPRGSTERPRGSTERPRGSTDHQRGAAPVGLPRSPDESPPHLARSTLVKLGFTRQHAHEAVQRALSHVGSDADLEALIRAALRHVPLGSRACESTVLYQAGPPTETHVGSRDQSHPADHDVPTRRRPCGVPPSRSRVVPESRFQRPARTVASCSAVAMPSRAADMMPPA